MFDVSAWRISFQFPYIQEQDFQETKNLQHLQTTHHQQPRPFMQG